MVIGRFALLLVMAAGCGVGEEPPVDVPRTCENTDLAKESRPNCGFPGALPCAPGADTTDDSDEETMHFLLLDLRMNQVAGGDWRDIGLDLDSLDTQAPDFFGDCSPITPTADGTGGIDNSFGSYLAAALLEHVPTFDCELNEAHRRGHGSLVVSVSRWNGMSDDAQVTVDLSRSLDATSDPITESDCANIAKIGDAMAGEIEFHELYDSDPLVLRAPPNLDGHDRVCTNPNSRVDDEPAGAFEITDRHAYISCGVLVMSPIAGSRIELSGHRSSFRLLLNSGHVVMPMSPDFQTIEGGVLSGRSPVTSLAKTGPDIGFCDPSVFVDQVEQAADILYSFDPDADGTAPCDAVSVGIGFDGVRANVVGSASAAVEPFFLCSGMGGPTSVPRIDWPVEACCNSFTDLGSAMDCNSHYNP